MIALVLGASGLVGKSLLRQLSEDRRYRKIVCLVRAPVTLPIPSIPHIEIEQVIVNFDTFDDFQGYFAVDHVYVCLGTTLKKAKSRAAFRQVDFEYVHMAAQYARGHKVKSFVWISSIGANSNSRFFYLRVKGELESSIFNLSGLAHAVAVRPSLLLGARQEMRLAETLGQYLSYICSFLMVGQLRQYRPVMADDVAKNMVAQQKFT